MYFCDTWMDFGTCVTRGPVKMSLSLSLSLHAHRGEFNNQEDEVELLCRESFALLTGKAKFSWVPLGDVEREREKINSSLSLSLYRNESEFLSVTSCASHKEKRTRKTN